MRSLRIFRIVMALALGLVVTFIQAGELKRVKVFSTPEHIVAQLRLMQSVMDTTLPAPELINEPPFSWGYENTIQWDRDSAINAAAAVGYDLLFFECRAGFAETEYWGFVASTIDSVTFTDLPTGIPIDYQVRYYAENALGEYGRSVWSNTTSSIQDAEAPVVEMLEIMDLMKSGGKQWVNNHTIQLHVVASDPDSGKIMQIAYRESNANGDHLFKDDIDPPAYRIDQLIRYTMYAEENQFVILSVWVVDVAGQVSEVHSETLFWWEYEELVCFPNPFNPDSGEFSTITLNAPDISEARIFDPLGNLVRILQKDPAIDFFEWDGRNGRGEVVSKGGYICVVDSDRRLYCKIAVWR